MIGPILTKFETIENFGSFWWLSPIPDCFVTRVQLMLHRYFVRDLHMWFWYLGVMSKEKLAIYLILHRVGIIIIYKLTLVHTIYICRK